MAAAGIQPRVPAEPRRIELMELISALKRFKDRVKEVRHRATVDGGKIDDIKVASHRFGLDRG